MQYTDFQELSAHIKNELTQTEMEVSRWFDLPSDVRQFKTGENWSINEILEHISLTNRFLLILIEKGTKKALNKAKMQSFDKRLVSLKDEFNLEKLEEIATNSFVWEHPEHMQPKGDLFNVPIQLAEQFAKCREFLAQMPNGEGFLHTTTMTVNGLGKIDVYSYIYFLAKHAKRHIKQMQKMSVSYAIYKEKNTACEPIISYKK